MNSNNKTIINAKSPTLYQNGIIDIFKLLKIYELDLNRLKKKGEVSSELDPQLGKNIIKITGTLSASNFLEIPNHENSKAINFAGKYYYIFIKVQKDIKFTFQLNFKINQDVVRFNFKFPLTEIRITKSNCYNVEIPLTLDSNWTIIKFDPINFINNNIQKDLSSIGTLTHENCILKSITFWSVINIKGVYVSNNSFDLTKLPKEMITKLNDNSSNYQLNFVDMIIRKPDEVDEPLEENITRKDFSAEEIIDVQSLNEIERKSKELKDESVRKSRDNFRISRRSNESQPKKKINEKIDYDFKEVQNEILKKNMESINKEALDKREIIKKIFKKEETKKKTLLPDPMMHLNYVLGYTSGICPVVKYDKSIDSKKFILFSSGNTLIKFDYENIRQKFFFGHSKPINNYIITNEGQTIFSCQESKNAIIRVWNANQMKCIKMLTTPFEKITSMSVSKDNRLLCTVGLESYNKEMIILWDISFVDDIKVFLRQGSHFNVKAIKFSPFEQNILVSCGKENIKFWRIKNENHLGGKAVVLHQYARANNFLCLDFDNPFIGEDCKGRVFVGSDQGCIYQISCNSMELEAIFKIQDSPILALSVNDAYCATGSQDGFLRVWPIDFSEFILEAKHDSGVCSVDISFDALEIVCGTLNGSIGTLNISNKQYKTILRSPPNNINYMAAHPSGNLLFTIEDDYSVRVWDVENKSEAFQYVSTKDPPTSVAAPQKNIFACGFTSGMLKIFDLDNTAIIYECRSFNTPIKALKYSQKDSILISMSAQGHMSFHDAANNYMQIKLIKIDSPAVNVDLALSMDEDYFATIGPESNCIIVWNSKSYLMRNRIPIYNFFVQKVCFITKNIIAIILENCCVQFYSLNLYEGVYLKEFTNIHMDKITQFLSTKNYKYLISGGAEGMIKIWDTKMLFRNFTSYQQFIGHPNSIKALICLDQKSLLVTSSESSGIFFWNYLGDLTFTETEINLELERLGNIREPNRDNKKLKNSRSLTAFSNNKKYGSNSQKKQQEHLDKIYNANNSANVNLIGNYTNIKTESSYAGDLNKNASEKRLKIDLNNYSADALKVLNMLPVEFDKNDKDNLPTEISQSLLFNSTSFNRYFTKDEMHNILLFKPKYVPEKIDRFNPPKTTSNRLKKEFLLGFSTNNINNIIYNKDNFWFAFTVNNKIVVELLEENRTQLILEEHQDEISVITMTLDGKFLISGAGLANKDEIAPICVWDTSNWSLKKKLNFHYKGIQTIKISNCGKYMISVGNKEERSVCVWNFSNLTVLDSKSLKFPIIDISCEKTSNEANLYFCSISFDVLSFWRIGLDQRLEGIHSRIDDLTIEREEGEVFISIEMTPYFENLRNSFILVGTNTGAIMIIEKEKKIMIKKYYISKSPLTKIIYLKNTLIALGNTPIIYSWKFNNKKENQDNIFAFIERDTSNVVFVESNITSIDIIPNGDEGLIGTDSGNIYYLNFLKDPPIKIISSHKNSFVNSIACDNQDKTIISCGDDGTIRSWTQDSFDQKFQFWKKNEVCNSVILSSIEERATILYNNNYLRIYNLSSLKSMGKIKIPDNDINCVQYIFKDQGFLVSSIQDRLFVLDVQNWDPLSVFFSEIDNDFMPKNQFFKYIDSKNISNTKSLALMSFSDGTCTVISIEKSLGKVDSSIVDKFNMFEYHISKSEDIQTAELYQNLTKFRTNYISSACFSKKHDDYLFCFHECLQFLYMRNYTRNEVFKRIPLNYFPSCLSVSPNENFIAIGTKEGLILFITKVDHSVNSGFNLDIFPGHCDYVKYLTFNNQCEKLISCSYSEILVWKIKAN